jgi:hypothetical protein
MSRYDWTGITPTQAESRMEDDAVKRVPDLTGEDPATFPNALLAELAAGTPVVGNVRSYGATGDGVTDDTAAIQACVDENEVVYFPPGEYVVRHRTQAADGSRVGVIIPAGRRLIGAGHRSVILNKVNNLATVTTHSADENWISWFWIDWNQHDVEIRDLRFLGEGPQVTDANFVLNLQMSVIEPAYNSIGGFGAAPDDVRVLGCWFERQYGFTVHQRGGGNRLRFEGNVSIDCMNGPNLNGHRQVCDRNYFLRSEGFECSGSYGSYGGNIFKDCYGCFSIGGDMGTGRGSWNVGNVVAGNLIDTTRSDGVYFPQAITVADNAHDTVVHGNHIHRARDVAIIVHSGDPVNRAVRRVTITDNHIVASRSGAPIYVPSGEDIVIDGNVIVDQFEDGTLCYEGETSAGALLIGGLVRNVRIGQNLMRVSGATKLYVDPGATEVWRDTPTGVLVPPGTIGYLAIDATRYGFVQWRLTDSIPRTILAPTNAVRGQTLELEFENASGGSMGTVSFDSVFRLAGTFGPPAAGARRLIAFRFDGGAWVEQYRSSTDL